MVSKLAKTQVLLQLLVGGIDGACGQRVYTLFVYLASLLIFYTSEKYLREKAWSEMKSLFPFRSLSILAKGEVFLKTAWYLLSTGVCLTCGPERKREEF